MAKMPEDQKFIIMDDDELEVLHVEDDYENIVELQIRERSTGNRMLIQITESQVKAITDAMLAR